MVRFSVFCCYIFLSYFLLIHYITRLITHHLHNATLIVSKVAVITPIEC